MSSVSTSGRTQITLQFSLERDIDSAAQDVQTAHQLGGPPPARRHALAAVVPQGQSRRSADPLSSRSASPTLPLSVLDQYGQTMSQRLSTISASPRCRCAASQKYAVRIQLDPVALKAFDLDADEVAKAVDAQNTNQPMGQLNGAQRNLTLQANGQLERGARSIEDIIVAVRNGRPVRLAEVATVIDSVENDQNARLVFHPDEQGPVDLSRGLQSSRA